MPATPEAAVAEALRAWGNPHLLPAPRQELHEFARRERDALKRHV